MSDSTSGVPNAQRALFANAPVLPAAQSIPSVPSGSNLAAAMMGQSHPMNLQAPNFGGQIPLSSIMQMVKGMGGQTNPTPGNNQTGLVRDASGQWVAGPSMGGQMPTLSYAMGNAPTQQQQPPVQGLAPGMPGGGVPGMPGQGAPGMSGGQAPGTPSPGAAGVPGADQPGLMGQTMSWLQNIYGGGGGG